MIQYKVYFLSDHVCISIQMDNGAAVTITYASNGDKSFPREEVQIFGGGGVFVIDNFKKAEQILGGKRRKWRSSGVDRGHKNELKETINAVRQGRTSPIDFHSLVSTTLTTFAIEESINKGKSIDVNLDSFLP